MKNYCIIKPMSNEKQMTALQWLDKQVRNFRDFDRYLDQALQMEREQIEKACSDYKEDMTDFIENSIPLSYKSPSDYYEKTYGK